MGGVEQLKKMVEEVEEFARGHFEKEAKEARFCNPLRILWLVFKREHKWGKWVGDARISETIPGLGTRWVGDRYKRSCLRCGKVEHEEIRTKQPTKYE